MKRVLAFDLGASNGRLILGEYENRKLNITEIHRFQNNPITIGDHLHWDLNYLFTEMKKGIKKFVEVYGKRIDGIGFDTWGVDFGLISEEGDLLENPYSYRDTHTVLFMDEVHEKIDKKKLFQMTGVEPAAINTLYQLYAILKTRPELIEKAKYILMTPSLFAYLFTGEIKNEFTISSTSQLLNWEKKDWDETILNKLFADKVNFAPLVETNRILAKTKASINKELGIDPANVIAVPGHDTACALGAMPIQNDQTSCFMSCGTWVLIGVTVEKPVVSDEAYEWGFTNEGTFDGKFRLQKNNTGLWFIQQCKKEWNDNGEGISYEEESRLIEEAEPFRSFINPNDPSFFNPPSMLKAIQDYCQKTLQPIPETKGQFLRCILESLAFQYRFVIERLENLIHHNIRSIHMGGGGIQNKWFCRFIAGAAKRTVYAGPVEASAIGNMLSQLIALGEIADLEEARKIVTNSFSFKTYEPENCDHWEKHYKSFLAIIK